MSMRNVCEKILLSEEKINLRISELGKEISKDYEGGEVTFISVLNGSFMFTADLLKKITIDSCVDFIQVSTYGNNTSSSGEFVLKKDLSLDIEGKDVIIVEDIIDSGYTIARLLEYIKQKNPASVKIATFIDKPARRKQNVEAQYVGFIIEEDYFIVGYGLDYAQKYRDLPYVGVLKEHIYS